MTPNIQFEETLRGYERTLEFLGFAELGHKPRITSREVVACFADIRGFTKLVQQAEEETCIDPAEILRDFFPLFPKAVLREAWDLERYDGQENEFQKTVRSHIFPSLWKKLGDGMLLVWEIDLDLDRDVKEGIKLAILDIVGYLQEYFYRLVNDSKKYDRLDPTDIDLGIGLAGGLAWRLNYGHGQVDYAGSPMNLAARLQDKARDRGICVHAKFASTHLVERRGVGEGRITEINVRGMRKPIRVWRSESPSLLRRRRRPSLSGKNVFQDLIKYLAEPPYEQRSPLGTDSLPQRGMCKADVESLLDIRQRYECEFASEAAGSQDDKGTLRELMAKMQSFNGDSPDDFRRLGQQFHEEIARLGGPGVERDTRATLVKTLHDWTTKIYPQTATDRTQIISEHNSIARAIEEGASFEASEKMAVHLREHDKRVIEEALSPSD